MNKKLIAAVCFAPILAIGIWLWSPLAANPSFAQLSRGAANYKVEIVRDDWGVPHIYGDTDADTAFGLGYAHAEDDFETIQEVVAATRGTLARYQGKSAAPTDYIVALLGVWDTIEKRYSEVPKPVQALAKAYADALNLYAAQHPKATWRGLAPFTEQDIIAGFVFKTPFFYGLDGTLLKLFGDERAVELALDTSKTRRAWHVGPKALVKRGSNAVAVSPKRSGDGVTRLLINSHQPMSGPVAWYEAHLISKNGLNITGGTFPGVPLILHGFNDDLGWANTVSAQDLVDVFVLSTNPKNPLQYFLDGKWKAFEIKTVPIKVKLFGPFAFTSKQKVLRSDHGPVVVSKHGTYAIRYAGMNEIHQLDQYYALNKAENLGEFMQGMAINALPSINYIYGDRKGNIGFIHNAQYPDRVGGWDWEKYLPGDRSDIIWQDYRPYSAVPKLINPSSGLVFNANNSPFSATDGPDNLVRENFPKSMGLQTNQTNRSLRLMELTDGTSKIGKEELLKIKFDNTYSVKSDAAKLVAEILAMDWSHDEILENAAKHLAQWDRSMAADSRHAALGGLTVVKQITAEFTHEDIPPPSEAFRGAVEYLMQYYGKIDPKWGELNRIIHGSANYPIDGGSDTLRAIYPQELGKDGVLKAGAGDTWIALVGWDEHGQLSADVIHQFGSATRNQDSPHFSDQVEFFATKKWRKALRGKEEILHHAERVYNPAQP